MQNLFNSKLRSYDQWVTATHNYYDQGQVIMFGVRGHLVIETTRGFFP